MVRSPAMNLIMPYARNSSFPDLLHKYMSLDVLGNPRNPRSSLITDLKRAMYVSHGEETAESAYYGSKASNACVAR